MNEYVITLKEIEKAYNFYITAAAFEASKPKENDLQSAIVMGKTFAYGEMLNKSDDEMINDINAEIERILGGTTL